MPIRRKKISFHFQASLISLELLAHDIGILVPKVINSVVLVICLGIALALEMEQLSWTLVSVLGLINKNEEINKIQQFYFSVSSLLFSGYPESQDVTSVSQSSLISSILVKASSKLKAMHKYSLLSENWKKM